MIVDETGMVSADLVALLEQATNKIDDITQPSIKYGLGVTTHKLTDYKNTFSDDHLFVFLCCI